MSPYPYLEVAVRIETEWYTGDALIDTGFEGALIIPRHVAAQLESLPSTSVLVMPDGHIQGVDVWEAELMLEHRTFTVKASAFGGEYILGRDVLDQMEVCFEFGRRARLRFEAVED